MMGARERLRPGQVTLERALSRLGRETEKRTLASPCYATPLEER